MGILGWDRGKISQVDEGKNLGRYFSTILKVNSETRIKAIYVYRPCNEVRKRDQ